MRFSRSSRSLSFLVAVCAIAIGAAPLSFAQRIEQKKTEKKSKPRTSTKSDEDARNIDLETRDGVLLAATFFPSAGGRETPIIVIMHGYGEVQAKTWELARSLNGAGYAVMTFDFRGHGYSTTVARDGQDPQKISYRDLGRKLQWQGLLYDAEAVKRFLVDRNNAGELNLSKLGLIGSEMGASAAMLYAFVDWQVPDQIGFGDKQAQDVQSLVLVSPTYNFKGLSVNKEITNLSKKLPIQVVVGKTSRRAFNEANKIYRTAQRGMPADSTMASFDTSLQGSKLLDPALDLGVDKEIIDFLNKNLKSRIIKWEKHQVPE